MLNSNIGKLIEHYSNRYNLVIKVAQKAREVAENAEKNGEILIEKPVSIAIDQLANEIRDD